MVAATLPYRSQDLTGGAGARQFICLPLAALLLWQSLTAFSMPEKPVMPLPPAQIKLGLVAVAGGSGRPVAEPVKKPVVDPIVKTIQKNVDKPVIQQPVTSKPARPSKPKPVAKVVKPLVPEQKTPVKPATRPIKKVAAVQQPVPVQPAPQAKQIAAKAEIVNAQPLAKPGPVQPVAVEQATRTRIAKTDSHDGRGKAAAGKGKAAATVLHKASYRKQVPPVYPRRAVKLGQQGTVIIHAEVLPNGKPRSLKVGESSGFRLLDKAAMSAVRKWRFEPASVNGQIQVAWMRVPVNFQIR